MNEDTNNTADTKVRDETLGEVTDTLASTELSEVVLDILPSTLVEEANTKD